MVKKNADFYINQIVIKNTLPPMPPDVADYIDWGRQRRLGERPKCLLGRMAFPSKKKSIIWTPMERSEGGHEKIK